MIRILGGVQKRVVRKYYSFLIFFGFFLFNTSVSYSNELYKPMLIKISLSTTQIISAGLFYFILILLGAILIICAVVIFFSIKLRKLNRELKEKNSHILDINDSLRKNNNELLQQKELITKGHYESEKFYGILVQSATDGISFYDQDWNLKYANPAFYELTGHDSKSYNLLNQQDLLHPDDQDYHAKRAGALLSNGLFESEIRLKHNDEHFVNLSSISVTVRSDNNDVLGFLTISRDITRLKQEHEDLIRANIDSEASNKLKTSFLANISHEIRTPLNSVVGFSNLLLANDISNEVKAEYIENINYNSEKLLQIIGDIIDLSRLESSQIEISYEETSLNSIVNEIIEGARQIIRRNEKSIILNIKNLFEDNNDLIFTDRIWLKRVLSHLMDNAIKFTLEGSIEFSYLRENEDIVFKIRDTGIGISKENLGHIFEEFRQEISGHHRPFEGLGIGLTLAKEVVERMGGKIFVQSEKGIGSEFGFSIPYRPAGSIKRKYKSISDDIPLTTLNWSSKKCLIVDDNKDMLIYLNRILIDTGATIITARSGIEAIELIKSFPDIDVVLLDMQMPEMNGIEATREIRKIRKHLPIIAQTAFIFEDDKDIILEAGCDACLIKPIRKDQLLTVMASFVKSN